MKYEEKAEQLFMEGRNCAQSVVGAFAEECGLDDETAARVSCGLGGGVGRTRETCGAVTGAAVVLGLRHGADKAAVYPHVQDFIARFKAETGSVVCRELLAGTGATAGGAPEARTPQYYRKRPCVELVKLAVRLLAEGRAAALALLAAFGAVGQSWGGGVLAPAGNGVQKGAPDSRGGEDAAAPCAAAPCAAAPNAVAAMGNVKLKGYLGTQLDKMIRGHVIGTDVDYITAPFLEKTETKNWWQTEFWGKYMHSAAPYLAYTRDATLARNVERGIDRMIASQEKGGYIGNYPDEKRCGEGWDVWGMKYTLMGLLHYYDYARGGGVLAPAGNGAKKGTSNSCGGGDAAAPCAAASGLRALEAAKRLCDYVIGEIGPNGRRGRELWTTGNWSGYASSSILEPVVWLYNRTGDERYLDFATYIVRGLSEPAAGPRLVDLALKGVSVADRNGIGQPARPGEAWKYVCKYGRDKAYEMMSCYQGLLDYCDAVEKKGAPAGLDVAKLREAAVKTAEDIMKEEINLAGGCASSEAWFHGARKQHLPFVRLQETCVTTTWMRFCERLMELTGEGRWADQLERTFYNAYLGAMKADGTEFAGYTPLTGNRYHGQHHCYMHTDCCTANGPRGFLCFLKELFRTRGDAVEFNFYASALVSAEVRGKRVAFDMYSLYPRTDYARIVSHTEGAGVVPMRLRIPAWCAKPLVTLNEKKVGGTVENGYVTFAHEWKLGDIVEVRLPMPTVAHVLDHHVAFTRGPILLARDSRLGPGDMTEPVRRQVKDGQTMDFRSVRTFSDEIWMEFTATLPIGSHHANPEGRLDETVRFCDYASAGNTWTRDNYYRTWFPLEWNRNE